MEEGGGFWRRCRVCGKERVPPPVDQMFGP